MSYHVMLLRITLIESIGNSQCWGLLKRNLILLLLEIFNLASKENNMGTFPIAKNSQQRIQGLR